LCWHRACGLRLQRNQSRDEGIKASWAEVLSQYQRRADLIPNIVNTVKGEANFEQETLTRRDRSARQGDLDPGNARIVNDPAALQKFQQAQGELSSAAFRDCW